MKFFRTFFIFLGAFVALTFGLPAAAQQNTTMCAGSGCTPLPVNLGGFGVKFDGTSWTSAIGVTNAGRGTTPISGKVVEEFAQAGSFQDSSASVGADVKITGFQPGTSCTADCSASQAVITGTGHSMAGSVGSHYMKTESVNGGPAVANSMTTGGSNTGIAMTATVNWLAQPKVLYPSTNVPQAPVAATSSTKP